LTAHFDTLEQIITQAELPDYAQAKFAKAKRQLSPMVETLHRFEQSRLTQTLTLSQLGLATLEHDLQQHLLPAVYLNKVAAQTSDVVQRHALQATADQLLRPLRTLMPPFNRSHQTYAITSKPSQWLVSRPFSAPVLVWKAAMVNRLAPS
jgi:hypothetical protein